MESLPAENKASLKGQEIVSSTIRTIVGPHAKVFLLSTFLREYAPHLNLKEPFKEDNTLGRLHNAVIKRHLGTLVSPSETLEPMKITTTGTSGSKRKHDVCQVQENVSTLVDDVIWSLVSNREIGQKGKGGRAHNVLSRGYVVASERMEQEVSRCPDMRPGVICKKLNGNARFCKTSRYFQILHGIVGDDVLRILLRRTSMFLPYLGDDEADSNAESTTFTIEGGTEMKDGAFCVSHDSISYVMVCGWLPKSPTRLLQACQPDETYCSVNNGTFSSVPLKNKNRKRKRNQTTTPAGEESCPPAKETVCLENHLGPNVAINRRSLFYSEKYIPKVGFPKHHILNQASQLKDNGGEVQLLKHIFPLENKIGDNDKPSGRMKQKRWDTLKSGGGPELCKDILKRHSRCDYHRLLDRCCPLSEVVQLAKREKEAAKRHEKESTSAISRSPDSSPQISLAQVSAAYTPPNAVIAFLTGVLERVFPISFWGSQHNFKKVVRVVDIFVKLRRYEDLPNKTIMNGIRITDVKWLSGSNTSAQVTEKGQVKRPKQSRSSHEAATKLATYVLRWLFSCFLIPLLRSNFYVTESEFQGKNVLYYRKPVWSLFRSLSMKHLLETQYTEIKLSDVKRLLANQHLGCSRLRLLPKETGVRPIATLCKRDESIELNLSSVQDDTTKRAAEATRSSPPEPKRRKLNGGAFMSVEVPESLPPTVPESNKIDLQSRFQSTNTLLRDSFEALKYEHGRVPGLFGAGITGFHEFYPRFLEFVESVKSDKQSTSSSSSFGLPRLYFASVDVRHCYDNIDQDRLLDMVLDILSEDDYMIHRYSQLQPCKSMNRLFMKKTSEVGPPASFNSLHKTQMPEGQAKRHGSVFIDEAGSTLAQKENIMSLLREHLKSHIVVTEGRFGDRYLLQTKGIPQGSVLSGYLCNLYYGNIEKNELLRELFQNKTGSSEHRHLLVRIIDDFLLVTTDPTIHQSFLQTMHKGNPSLGVTINKSKIVSNFEVSVESENGEIHVIQDTTPNWNGLFPWCGMLFDTRKCEVLIDYFRMVGGQAKNSLTVSRSEGPGVQLRRLMKTFVRPRCLPILFDASLNSRATMEANFFDLCVVCAVKTEECLKSSDMLDTLTANVAFIISSIDDAIFYALQVIRNRLVANGGAQPNIFHLNIPWALSLGWKAFHASFQKSESLAWLMVHIDEKLRSLRTGAMVPKQVLEKSQMSMILCS